MRKFKVGDKVRVREWEDMVRRWGTDRDGDISCGPCFTRLMKRFCGGVYKILSFTGVSYVLEGAGGCFFAEDTLFPAITYREYAQKNFPGRVNDGFLGGVHGCPREFGFHDFSNYDYCEPLNTRCYNCWDHYMTEAEYKKFVLKEEEEKKMFKVGDYVKVVKPANGRTISWVTRMNWTIGRTFKISKVDSDNTCQLEGTDSVWFAFEALEPATPKDILYPFCTVKLRSGNVYLFYGKNRLLREGRWLDTDNHDENLNSSFGDDFDVMDICAQSDHVTELLELLTKRGECIWRREEVVEITAEEAAKKLKDQYPGQTVKIVC